VKQHSIVIVGAGIAGLTVAAELAPRYDVTVIDRLPAVGGILGYEHRMVREYQRRCERLGVTFLLGATALRWEEHRLLVASPLRIQWLAANHLVYAGGSRPSTLAEMRIVGSRLAGVLSATVAVHLMEARVRLGNNVLVVGTGDWAERAAHEVERQKARLSVVVLDDDEVPSYGAVHWTGWVPQAVMGIARVTGLMVERHKERQRITCDALIVAGTTKPLRNIDGAVFDGTNVTFVQCADNHTTTAAVHAQALGASAQIEGLLQSLQVKRLRPKSSGVDRSARG